MLCLSKGTSSIVQTFLATKSFSTRASIYYNDPRLWAQNKDSRIIKKDHLWFPWMAFASGSFNQMEDGLVQSQKDGLLLLSSRGTTSKWSSQISRNVWNTSQTEPKDSPFLKSLFSKLAVVLSWTKDESDLFYNQIHYDLASEVKNKQWLMVRIEECTSRNRKDCNEWDLAIMEIVLSKQWLNCWQSIEANTYRTTVAVKKD